MLIKVLHLCCYLLAMVPSIFVAFSIDYSKFVNKKGNNINYYLTAFIIGAASTYLVGELLYSLITLFM